MIENTDTLSELSNTIDEMSHNKKAYKSGFNSSIKLKPINSTLTIILTSKILISTKSNSQSSQTKILTNKSRNNSD